MVSAQNEEPVLSNWTGDVSLPCHGRKGVDTYMVEDIPVGVSHLRSMSAGIILRKSWSCSNTEVSLDEFLVLVATCEVQVEVCILNGF